MLWVLKRTVSMRQFFKAPKTHVYLMDKKIITISPWHFLLNCPYVEPPLDRPLGPINDYA